MTASLRKLYIPVWVLFRLSILSVYWQIVVEHLFGQAAQYETWRRKWLDGEYIACLHRRDTCMRAGRDCSSFGLVVRTY